MPDPFQDMWLGLFVLVRIGRPELPDSDTGIRPCPSFSPSRPYGANIEY